MGNRYSPTIVVAAITSKAWAKSKLPTHISISSEFGLNRDSIVLLEHLRTIDCNRLIKYIGTLDEETMVQINKALAISIGLINHPFSKAENLEDTLMFCLCPACASRFYDLPDHRVRRLDYSEVDTDKCDCCN